MPNTEAIAARDAGIATAVEHADRIDPTWRFRAYDALERYAKTHPTFTIEQLRASLNGSLEDPPSLRAWGGIAQRAARVGLIEHHGWQPAENPDCHCGEVRVWRSRLCPAPATSHRTPFRLVDTERSAEFGDMTNAGVSVAFVKDLERRLAITNTALRHVYQTLLLVPHGNAWRIRHQSVYAACRDPQVVQDVAEEAAAQRRVERGVR
jgi:hypothetical protein